MARSNVPKFGNWESDDNVPYTVYFDKARKNRGGKMINPNDPQENPDLFPNNDPSSLERASSDPPPSRPVVKPDEPRIRSGHEHRRSREDGDMKNQFSNTPTRADPKPGNESGYGGRAQRPARAARRSEGSEQGLERSPLHPHYQAKAAGRVGASPSWEGKSHDNSTHGTPGRSRLKPTKGDESPEKGAAVPRFGEWNENDPQAAENFTHIFNKVREERNTEAGNVSGTPKHPSYGTRQQPKEIKKSGCFCW